MFCCDKKDLAVGADAEAMGVDTGDAKPRKARPYKAGANELKVLNETVSG